MSCVIARLFILLLLPFAFQLCASHAAQQPQATSDQYQLELIAEDPTIVTPIGMTFDREGRLLVVESHTHQRRPDYKGPAGDRIRMFADSDGDGRLDRWTTFAEGFRHVMNLAAHPEGGIYVLARHGLMLVRDTNGDGQADEQRELARLETEDDYPHNGLSGIARLADGSLLLGLGENHGLAYRLVGTDGSSLSGTNGLDGVIHISAEGGNVEWFANGVWNPFSICVDPRGRIFAVDNDPDASPPCRLLHVVRGGDYGYLFQYGRAGTHPLQAWNGELPDTLPMVCGVGEAPTAIIAHAGSLWVTSWGDHRLERYRLVPRGASFGAQREVVVQGNTNFRPTGLAAAPDGSLYFGDWELLNYNVHGRGRIWRLALPADELRQQFPPLTGDEQHAAKLDSAEISSAICSDDPFLRATAIEKLAEQHDPATSVAEPDVKPCMRLARLAALRRQHAKPDESLLRAALADPSPKVRLYAVRRIADERVTALRDDIARLLDGPLPTPRYYLAVLSAVDWLDHQFDASTTTGVSETLLVRELENSNRAPEVHALALQLLPTNNKFLTLDRLTKLLKSPAEPLRLEAIRTLSQQSNPERFQLLAATARDVNQSDAVRAEALVGLAAAAGEYQEVLKELSAGNHPMLAREATRTLRLAQSNSEIAEDKPAADDLAAWNELLQQPGDADAGRRLFFSAVGARCAICHQFDGRGGKIGPDLTQVGRNTSRERIIASILQPSREIAPEFQPWLILDVDGKTYSCLRLPKSGDDGFEPYADSAGNTFTLKSQDIDMRQSSDVSIMPEGLEKIVSIQDLRDLLAFLCDSEPEQ